MKSPKESFKSLKDTFTLSNGVQIPCVGFGTYLTPDGETAVSSVIEAVHAGYRHIDTAAVYGNEKSVGKAICKCGTDRKELFITSKVWNSAQGYETTLHAFDKTLSDLELDYLDLYLIHQPFGDVYGAWRAMEELYREGKVRAIGVSNFQPDRLVDLILHNEVVPAVNQVETHPFCQQAEEAGIMARYGVQAEAWAPFAEGRNNLFGNEVLTDLAAKHRKSVAQVVLRWLIQRGIVVIPKSVHKERMAENIDVFDFTLPPEDMARIAALDMKQSCFLSHRDPQTVEWLGTMKYDLDK